MAYYCGMESRITLWIKTSWIGIVLSVSMVLVGLVFRKLNNDTLESFFLWGGLVCVIFFAANMACALIVWGLKKLSF